jgi:hypothetical protein
MFKFTKIEQNTGKPFEVDVPVCFSIWSRPKLQLRQFEIIKKAKPSVMFLVSNGKLNDEHEKLLQESRLLVENGIDWNCTIYKYYENINIGPYSFQNNYYSGVWKIVDRCIFMDDDCIPSVSFFSFCAELLEKYKNDTRIFWINGMNYEGESQEVSSDYFFSKSGCGWGFATWKRVFEQCWGMLDYSKDPYVMSLLKYMKKEDDNFYDQLIGFSKNEYFDGHRPSVEFFFGSNRYLQNQLYISPKRNLVLNAGCNIESWHGSPMNQMPKKERSIYLLKTYELSFPIKHQEYVIVNKRYDDFVNDIFCIGRPALRTFRKIEKAFLILIHGGTRRFFYKAKVFLKRKINNKNIDG